ncbi:hypothetical protein H4R34_004301 [Dimargaris verticillata]|uniref:DUF4286 family protein n=1 Tax=Dimargaris verticillata TaxID=2761393 RepID=A0A9W8AZ75_9FUNG|nr:hypothetical protein H4R34_004301 [Dimargaris verticillata]
MANPKALVYEVNLSLPTDVSADYVAWLKDFTHEQCSRIDGFLESRIFRSTSKPGNLRQHEYFTVHYIVRSQADLDRYLENHQKELASAEKTKFRFLVTSRRVLELLD